MPDIKSARTLLIAATRDLRALVATANTGDVADEVFGFLAQQAVEKALKAWISLLDIRYPFTHNLETLLVILRNEGVDVDDLLTVSDLNPFAVELRYSALAAFDPPLDRAAIVGQVQSIVLRVDALFTSTNSRAEEET